MTNEQSPITPPDELRRLWAQQAQQIDPRDPVAWMQHVSAQAAQWGADQELEACCELIADWIPQWVEELKEIRRPKPPSLKEQALGALERQSTRSIPSLASNNDCNTIRRALETL